MRPRRCSSDGTLQKKTVVATVMSQPRARARARRAWARSSCARRSATATSSRRCAPGATTSAASSPATSSSSTTRRPATACSRALQVLALMLRSGKPLSELAEEAMQRVPQVLENVTLPVAPPARGDAAPRGADGEDRQARSATTGASSCAGAAPSPSSASCSRAPARSGSASGPRSSPPRRRTTSAPATDHGSAPAGGISGGAASLPPGRSGYLCGGRGADRAKRVEAERPHRTALVSGTGTPRSDRTGPPWYRERERRGATAQDYAGISSGSARA